MICTLTINPAIDKLLYIGELKLNNTNRIKETCDAIGGKGTHVSINLSILKCPNRAYGIGLGKNGLRIEAMLKKTEYIDTQFLHFSQGKSRTNYAVIDENESCTLYTEAGMTLSKKMCEDLIERMKMTLQDGDYLVLSGDASNTEIPYIYNYILNSFEEKKIKVFLDTSSNNLTEGIKKYPFLIKPNVDELSQLVGRDLRTEKEIIEGISQIASKGIECVAVSCGKNGSIASYKDKIYKVYPVDIKVANTIGCGDAYLCGMVYGFYKNMEFEEILRYAAAISSAAAETNLTVGYSLNRALELKDYIRVVKLN